MWFTIVTLGICFLVAFITDIWDIYNNRKYEWLI